MKFPAGNYDDAQLNALKSASVLSELTTQKALLRCDQMEKNRKGEGRTNGCGATSGRREAGPSLQFGMRRDSDCPKKPGGGRQEHLATLLRCGVVALSENFVMHPAMALWIWSIAMSRIWQDSLSASEIFPEMSQSRCEDAETKSIAVARPYVKSSETEDVLPDIILDRLAHLYWLEREPALAV